MLLKPTTGKMSHMVTSHEQRQKKQETICNQYKPNISVFIRDTESINDNQIHEDDLYEVEKTYTPSVGAAEMLLHINGKFTT